MSREWGWLGPQVLVLIARRASGTPGHGTSCKPKATECVKQESLCTDLGKGAGNGLSGDFLCLSLCVTGLG